MLRKIKGLVVLAAGVIFVFIGLAGVVLPILPGWLFVLLGLFLLSLYFPGLRRWLDSHSLRWPRLHKMIHKLHEWAERNIGRL